MQLHTAALTDLGLRREENEDCILCDDTLGIYAVADGIGGLPCGAEASREAVESLQAWIRGHGSEPQPDYLAGLRRINDHVLAVGRRLSPQHGLGTTLTAAHLAGDRMTVLHAGDSALFRWREGVFEPLTTIHNVETENQRAQARGEPPPFLHERPGAITRCIGQEEPFVPEIIPHSLRAGDRYLLCTDGITNCIANERLSRLTREATDPGTLARGLVARANAAGGRDNASVVVIVVTA